ncbi:DNA polymerase eta [Dirofilaria immitis]
MDCFYVQVEQRLQPHLYNKPVAVVQHSSVNYKGGGLLAVSYEARPFGIKRGMFGEQAKALCPDLTLCYVPIGEHIDKADITRYRDASAEVFKVLHEFDSRIIVERASVDEAYLDLSALVQHIFETTDPSVKYRRSNALDLFPTTHVADGADLNEEGIPDWKYDRTESLHSFLTEACETKDEYKLKLIIGADLIEQIRSDIKKNTAFNCSAGIGSSKMIAKLVCSRHKPGQQTVVFNEAISKVLKYTPINEVRNLGGKLGRALMEKFNIKTMGELSEISMSNLSDCFSAQARWVYNIARGIDEEKVTARDKQSSVAVSKNFPGPNALKTDGDVKFWLEGLIKELVKRLIDDQITNIRTASTLHIGCTTDAHITRSMQMKTYDPKALFTSVWAIFRHINKSKILETWDPSVKNITLSADRFREGIDGRSKQITEWVTTAMDKAMNSVSNTSNSAGIGSSAMSNEKLTKPSPENLVTMHHSEREAQEQDEDIQIILDVKKKMTSTFTAVRPKTTIKKRKKRKESEKKTKLLVLLIAVQHYFTKEEWNILKLNKPIQKGREGTFGWRILRKSMVLYEKSVAWHNDNFFFEKFVHGVGFEPTHRSRYQNTHVTHRTRVKHITA